MKNFLKLVFYYTHYPLLFFIKKTKLKEITFTNNSYVIASNHASILDPVLLTMYFYHNYSVWLRFLSSDKIYRNPIMRVYLYVFDSIKIEKQNKALSIEISVDLLKNGKNVGIFPEGKRTNKKLTKIKTGVIRLSSLSKRDIIPVKISGTEKVFSKGRFIPKITQFTIQLGKPISYTKFSAKKVSYADLKRASKRIMQEIYSLE